MEEISKKQKIDYDNNWLKETREELWKEIRNLWDVVLYIDDPDMSKPEELLQEIWSKYPKFQGIEEDDGFYEDKIYLLFNDDFLKNDDPNLSVEDLLSILKIFSDHIKWIFVYIGREDVTKLIYERSFVTDPNIVIHGQTAVFHTAHWGSKNKLRYLLSFENIDPNKRFSLKTSDEFSEGETPLMAAAKNSTSENVKMLLAHPKIRVNDQDSLGQTALMKAAARTSNYGIDIVNLLLSDERVIAHIKDKNGKTAYDLCKSAKCKQLLFEKILQDRGVPKLDNNSLYLLMKSLRHQEICDEVYKQVTLFNNLKRTRKNRQERKNIASKLYDLRLELRRLAQEMEIPWDEVEKLELLELCKFLSEIIGFDGVYNKEVQSFLDKKAQLRELYKLQKQYNELLSSIFVDEKGKTPEELQQLREEVKSKSLEQWQKEAQSSYFDPNEPK